MTAQPSPCDLTATTLARAIARRELSAREAVDAHLARIVREDSELSACVTVDAEGARRAAGLCDAAPAPLGPLHGVPVGIKDLTDTGGL
ncbi:MAG: amidase family protein, partial [Bradyrhizobium guangdongense]